MNLQFKYLAIGAIGGRGGVQRFFMLSHDIAFQEELFSPGPEWSAEKARMIESGENPAGGVPVSYPTHPCGKKEILSQHIAACRYLAKINNIENKDAYKNFVQDLVADEYQGFRNTWADNAFSNSDDAKATYKTETLPALLVKFETLYKVYKTDATYLSTSSSGKPLWGDAAMFGVLYDNIQTGFMEQGAIAEYPNLSTLYKAYAAIPAVAKWIESHKK